jgi:hypothetical protein
VDAFEQLVSEILWMSGFWVRTSVKVELTKEEKRLIGRHSAPRWELDIVGYRARENLLRVVECKSYMDSTGVRASAFDGSNAEHAKRYKLFNEPDLRRVVFNRLCLQFTESGACREAPQVRLALACGKIRNEGGPHGDPCSLRDARLGFVGRTVVARASAAHGRTRLRKPSIRRRRKAAAQRKGRVKSCGSRRKELSAPFHVDSYAS